MMAMRYHAAFAPVNIKVMRVKSPAGRGSGWIARGLIVALALFGCAITAQAEDLYESQVPVSGQQERERTRALRVAFEQVLLKVTGHRDTARAPAIEAALRQPMRYVQQYLYLPLPADETGERLREEGQREMLRVRFDVNAVTLLLREAGVPQWGRTRPVTLVWLAVEDRGERRVLGGEVGIGQRAAIEREARVRGIPVLLPLMDLEDRRELHFTDIWGNFRDTLLQASARYQPGAVLAGRLLHEADDSWSARWSLYHDGHTDHWTAAAADSDGVIAAGIHGVADLLASRHARVVTADDRESIELVVTDVRGIDGYERAMKYLAGLDPVERLQVVGLEGDRLRFRLNLSGSPESLVRLIGFGSVLVPQAPAQSADDGVRELSYRLLP